MGVIGAYAQWDKETDRHTEPRTSQLLDIIGLGAKSVNNYRYIHKAAARAVQVRPQLKVNTK